MINKNIQHKIINIFLLIIFSIYFGCSKEPSHWDGSFEYPQHILWLRSKKIIFLLHTLLLIYVNVISSLAFTIYTCFELIQARGSNFGKQKQKSGQRVIFNDTCVISSSDSLCHSLLSINFSHLLQSCNSYWAKTFTLKPICSATVTSKKCWMCQA